MVPRKGIPCWPRYWMHSILPASETFTYVNKIHTEFTNQVAFFLSVRAHKTQKGITLNIIVQPGKVLKPFMLTKIVVVFLKMTWKKRNFPEDWIVHLLKKSTATVSYMLMMLNQFCCFQDRVVFWEKKSLNF